MRPFIGDDHTDWVAVTKFFFSSPQSLQGCNRNALPPVINSGVDAFLNTWTILMQVAWLLPRFSTMIMQLAKWFAGSIRLSQKWSAPIDRDALLKKTFAK
jgi:hypothetical protein